MLVRVNKLDYITMLSYRFKPQFWILFYNIVFLSQINITTLYTFKLYLATHFPKKAYSNIIKEGESTRVHKRVEFLGL